jgi:hypothetical protein
MRYVLLLLCVILSGQTMAEEITFDMSVWGFKFGQMTVTKTMENDSTEVYTMSASGKVNFLWMKKEGSTKYKVIIVNGQMISSSYIRIVNGETDYWNEVVFDGEKYQVESNKGNRAFTEIPDNTILALYFNPTTQHKRIYCEAESEFSTLSTPNEDGFELHCTDGSRTSYHLVNGLVNSMEIHASLASIKMKRVK